MSTITLLVINLLPRRQQLIQVRFWLTVSFEKDCGLCVGYW